MSIWVLLWLSAGLAADAFAVSLSFGMASKSRLPVGTAGTFGVFQGVMPLLGYGLAHLFTRGMQAMGHWVACLLLVMLGLKMIWESRGSEPLTPHNDRRTVLFLALATSMDALAVGASLAVMPHSGVLALPFGFAVSAGVIAAVTFVLCWIGLWIGARAGNRLGKHAGTVGGVVLIGIGVKILLEHLCA